MTGACKPQNYFQNVVRNQKYNVFTILPIFFYNQFKFFFNLFFLLVALTQFIEVLKIGFMITYIGPLVFVLTLSFAKEVYDEFQRAMKDKQYNSEKFT